MGRTSKIDAADLEAFAGRLRGALLRPDDDDYGDARTIFNGMVDREPELIARCAGTADVIATVRFVREHDVPLGVKGGGHNVAGRAVPDGGLMLDLSGMDAVRVDPAARVARVRPGATWGIFDHEAQAFSLATTGGVDSRTGVAGLTLGGGLGWLARKHGLACDNLLSADVVTADGELVRASEEENPDLFWALRGGGGSFGIVTSFEFRLHEVGPELMVSQAFHLLEDARDVLAFYRDATEDAPDELAALPIALPIPPMEPFPEEHHGATAVAIVATYTGSLDEAHDVLAPFEDFGDPIVAFTQPMAYTTLQSSFDVAPTGARYYYKSHYLDEITDEAIDTIVDNLDPMPGAYTLFDLEPMGGVVNRVATNATAFAHRDSRCVVGIYAGTDDPSEDDEIIAWARGFYEALAPHATGGMYTNYLDRDDDERGVRAALGSNYERLVETKDRWDPDNVFGENQFIQPSG